MGHTLYIGLNGLAGSGKDTVAKILHTILNRDWDDKEECRSYYRKTFKNPTLSATYHLEHKDDDKVMCIAFADQLKQICSSIFGVPIDVFYGNKSNAWINLKDFRYTESKPYYDIVTAEEFFFDEEKDTNRNAWMSIREVLVYIGTYVMQYSISKNVFVNILRNKVFQEMRINDCLEYVIVTDIRFPHELRYIQDNNGITINIQRESVNQLNNIAEQDIDTEWDYVIHNDAGYGELFDQVWDMVHHNKVFENECEELISHDRSNNYLRKVGNSIFTLCPEYDMTRIMFNEDEICAIDPSGGPYIEVGRPISVKSGHTLIPEEIYRDGTHYNIKMSNTYKVEV